MTRKRLPDWLGALVLALGILGFGAATAGATFSKVYSVSLPTSLGVAEQTFTATLRNLSTNQSLGSVDLTAPPGLDLQSASASRGTVALVGETVRVRSLGLPPGSSTTVSIAADVACAGGGRWGTAARHSNDFKGRGNDFVLDAARSQRDTIQAGKCEVQTVCAEDVRCSDSLSFHGVLDTLDGPWTPYTLRLETSAYFTENLPDAGRLTMAWQPGEPLDCAGYDEVAPVRGLVVGPDNRTKGVRVTIGRPLMDLRGVGADDLEMCFAAPQPFLPDPNKPAISYTMVDGQLWPTAILPDCIGPEEPSDEPSTNDLPQLFPCVHGRSLDAQGNGVIDVEVPYTYADPAYRS